MSNKRDLHTLFIKHDTDFGTLSKKALSEVILKIIFFQNSGTKLPQIKTELSSVIQGNISDNEIIESLRILERTNKVTAKRGKYSIHKDILIKLQKSAKENTDLQERVFTKYLAGGQSSPAILKIWFQDTLIKFFESYSMEWFNHLVQKGKFSPKKMDNTISSVIDEVLISYSAQLVSEDTAWFKSQFIKFYESDEHDENMMFWNFGISLFSSRIITARNYADKISIDTFKNGTFILDTNILMILDLEGHEFEKSFSSLDKILNRLNIKTKYFHITREEYIRAIAGRKADTIHVFESFDSEVLATTKCPFVQTAIRRGCKTREDLERMFDSICDVPKSISTLTSIDMIDYAELELEIQKGSSDETLKSKIEEIHFGRFKGHKRENPKKHDSGMIYGINFLRKTESAWVLTTDGTLKMYAINNILRDETEIAIGLDALIGMFAVNNGGVDVDSSDFAPLFKSLIKNSLIPEDHVFDVRDLAFILSTNLRINDLENKRVVEIANGVRKMRISGEADAEISLFLRREIEGEKIEIVKDLNKAKANENLAISRKEEVERERDLAYSEIREQRRGELRDEYDNKLTLNRFLLIFIPVLFSVCFFLTFRYGFRTNQLTQYVVGCSVEFIFGLLPYWTLNKKLVKKHSEYVLGIDKKVEDEIIEMKKRAKI